MNQLDKPNEQENQIKYNSLGKRNNIVTPENKKAKVGFKNY